MLFLSIRSQRVRKVKFVERSITHKRDTNSKRDHWCNGTVVDVYSGKDGQDGTIHQVLYENETEIIHVHNLIEDYNRGFVKFTDV